MLRPIPFAKTKFQRWYHLVLHSTPTLPSSQLYTLAQRQEAAQEVRRALVAARVLVQVQLVVGFGVPPLAGGQDLGDHAALPPLLVHLVCDLPRLLLLLLVVIEDATAVLASDIRALAVRGCGVVHLVEELDECAVGYLFGVVDDLEGFGVYRNPLVSEDLVRKFVD